MTGSGSKTGGASTRKVTRDRGAAPYVMLILKAFEHSVENAEMDLYGKKPARKFAGHQKNTWNRLDMTSIQALWTVYNSDFVARAAKNYIASSLLSGGVVIADESMTTGPGSEFQAFIGDHFVPFFKDVIDHIYVQGFAPFVLPNGVPTVIPFGCVQYSYLIDEEYKITLGAFDETTQDEPLPDVFFIIESNVTLAGEIVSPASLYYQHRTFRDMVLRNTAIAQYFQALPPVFLTQKSQNTFDGELDVVGGEVPGLHAALANDNLTERNNITANVHERQERMIERLNAKRASLQSHGLVSQRDPVTGLAHYDMGITDPTLMQSLIPLANDQTPVTTAQSRAPENLVGTLSQQYTIACTCFGISPENIGLSHTVMRSAEAIELEQVISQTTVRKFRGHFVRTLQDIYKHVWHDETKHGPSTIAVLFPSMLDRKTMLDLYARGIVSYDGVRDFLIKQLDISPVFINAAIQPPGAPPSEQRAAAMPPRLQ